MLAGHERERQRDKHTPVSFAICLSTAHSAAVRDPRDPAEPCDPAEPRDVGRDIFQVSPPYPAPLVQKVWADDKRPWVHCEFGEK